MIIYNCSNFINLRKKLSIKVNGTVNTRWIYKQGYSYQLFIHYDGNKWHRKIKVDIYLMNFYGFIVDSLLHFMFSSKTIIFIVI